jgi:hypothetical protein
MEQRTEDDLRSESGTVEAADGGRKIILNFPTLEEAAQLMNPWRDSGSRARAISKLHQALTTVGLNLEIRVNGRSMVELGAESMRGAMLTLLGVNPAEEGKQPLSAER